MYLIPLKYTLKNCIFDVTYILPRFKKLAEKEGSTTSKNILVLPQISKHEVTIGPCNSTPRYTSTNVTYFN